MLGDGRPGPDGGRGRLATGNRPVRRPCGAPRRHPLPRRRPVGHRYRRWLGSPDGIRRQIAGVRHRTSRDERSLDADGLLHRGRPRAQAARSRFSRAPRRPSTESWENFGRRYAAQLLALACLHVAGLDEADVLAAVRETLTSLARRSRHNIGGSCHGANSSSPAANTFRAGRAMRPRSNGCS